MLNLYFKANEDGEYVTISNEDQPKSAESSSGSKPGMLIFSFFLGPIMKLNS